MKQNELFKDITVIESASVLAGPSVGMFFAELGADVIKIENKKNKGDVTRSWKLASEDPDHPFSAYYASVNWGKQSLFLDLTLDEDHQKLIEKIKTAQVFICNFKPGDAAKFGLDYKTISTINPAIIYGEITGFGQEDRLAYDIVLQAETGFLSMNGSPDGEMAKMPVAFIDLFAAHQLKEGILLAMLQQQKNPGAYLVQVSLYDAALSALTNQATNWLMAKSIAKPLGMLHPNIAPYGEKFPCKDQKEIVLAVGSNRQFRALCECLELAKLQEDSRFMTNQSRVLNRKELWTLLAPAFLKADRKFMMDKLLQAKVPAGAIRNMKEVFDQDASKSQLIREEKENKELISVKGNAFSIKR